MAFPKIILRNCFNFKTKEIININKIENTPIQGLSLTYLLFQPKTLDAQIPEARHQRKFKQTDWLLLLFFLRGEIRNPVNQNPGLFER